MIPTAFVLEIVTVIMFILIVLSIGKIVQSISSAGRKITESLDRLRDTIHDKQLTIKSDND